MERTFNPDTCNPDTTRSFRRYAFGVLALIAATIGLAVSGVQFEREMALPVSLDNVPPGEKTPQVKHSAPEHAGHEQAVPESAGVSGARWIAALPERTDELRWIRLSAQLGGAVPAAGSDDAAQPTLTHGFVHLNGTRQHEKQWLIPTDELESIEWQSIRAWPSEASAVVAAVLPLSAHGTGGINSFTVEVLSLSALYRGLLAVLVAGWVVMGLVAINHAKNHAGGTWTIVPLALVSCIAAAVLFSGDFIEQVVRPIVSLAHGTRGGVSLVPTFKIGHGVAFCLLTCSLLAVRQRLALSPAQCFALVAMVGLASEAAQLHVPARTPQLTDLAIDATGMLAGGVLWRLLEWQGRQRARRLVHRVSSTYGR